MAVDAKRALAEQVSIGDGYKPFGELTAEEIAARGAELSEATGFGHGGRVAGVAQAWRELSALMMKQGAKRVSELDDDTVATYAERLWVVPPGGSLL